MTHKWSSEQIIVLIDAYKEEPCLYATNSSNYHNKHLRTAALNRVSNAVLRVRPTVTTKECSNKFHNLRNQFNIEHSKVKTSLKSGTGTDDVYKPSLWYYEKLLFLESYITPRRNRTSFSSEASLSDAPLNQVTATHTIEENFEDANCYENIEYLEDVFIPELAEIIQVQGNICGSSSAEQVLNTNSSSLHRPRRSSQSPERSRSSSLSSVTTDNQQVDVVFPRPNTSTQSGSSTSGVCTSVRRKKKNRRSDDSDAFSTVMKNLTDSINTPIAINTPSTNLTPDSVDGFLTFMGSLLRGFQDEEFKLEVMNQVTQLIINAKTTDYQRSKRNK